MGVRISGLEDSGSPDEAFQNPKTVPSILGYWLPCNDVDRSELAVAHESCRTSCLFWPMALLCCSLLLPRLLTESMIPQWRSIPGGSWLYLLLCHSITSSISYSNFRSWCSSAMVRCCPFNLEAGETFSSTAKDPRFFAGVYYNLNPRNRQMSAAGAHRLNREA